MNPQSKLLLSITGVCIPAALVVGAVAAVATHRDPAPDGQLPGSPVSTVVPTVATSTVSRSASLAPDAKAGASSLVVSTTAAPRRHVVVQNQGEPVTDPQPVVPPTDPTTPDPAPAPSSDSPNEGSIDLGTGTVDEQGVRRAPTVTVPHPPHPSPPEVN